jgi:hypothetical protein
MAVEKVSLDRMYQLLANEMAKQLPIDQVSDFMRRVQIAKTDDSARPNWVAAVGTAPLSALSVYNDALLVLRANYDLE